MAKNPQQIQNAFFGQMRDSHCFRHLLEYLPGVYFFVKDRGSRLMAGNRLLLDRLGLRSEAELIGTSDSDHFPPEVCAGFLRDDQRLFESGEPITDRVELGYNERRILDWYVTKKMPIFGHKDEVIGLMGLTQICMTADQPFPAAFARIDGALELVRQNPDRRVSSEEMAKAAGMSVSQLRKRFRDSFGKTPHEFELLSRVQGASQALVETTATISEIAIDFGFYDQSALSTQFRKHTGYSPTEYRNLRTTS